MYNNFYQPMQGMQQPNPYMQRLLDMQQPIQAPIQPPPGLVRVTGIDGAKAYQMPANGVAALFDANDDVFYVKSTDGAGLPTIRAFRFSPVEQTAAQPDFVTRQEFEELKGMILNGKQPIPGTEQPHAKPDADC